MKFNPEIHHRRSIRLKGYDYSETGAYFVTIGTQNRACLFGVIVGANGIRPEMILNEHGKIVQDEWLKSGEIRSEIELDEFVIMPNHFHGIVIINRSRGDRPVAPTAGPQPKSIGSLMAGFKSAVTKRINELRQIRRFPVWQRNYYEHIIRADDELNRIREYIMTNPLNWNSDNYNPMQNN